jgi:hypothetical protein
MSVQIEIALVLSTGCKPLMDGTGKEGGGGAWAGGGDWAGGGA